MNVLFNDIEFHYIDITMKEFEIASGFLEIMSYKIENMQFKTKAA